MRTCGQCGREYGTLTAFCPADGQLLDAFDAADLCGQVIDKRYRLEQKLGEGAYGVVFRAEQLDIDRTVAVKILHPAKVLHAGVLSGIDDARDYWLSCVVRFQREAKAAGRLRHPNIVAVTDFGRAAGDVVYLAMEYLTGASLKDIIKSRGPLPLPYTARIVHQVGWAVAAAHREGVIHRDLKPANIIVEDIEGIGEIAKVCDFGIAKLTAALDQEITSLTDTGVFLGTPKYMSPEQCSGGELDARSDVYSLGVVVYEMLTGDLPFHGTAIAVALQHTTTPPRPLRELAPDIPESVERVVLRALAKDPSRRHQSTVELATDLERAAGATGLAYAMTNPLLDVEWGLGEGGDTQELDAKAFPENAGPAPAKRPASRIEVSLPRRPAPAERSARDASAPAPGPPPQAAGALDAARPDPGASDSQTDTRVRPPLPAAPRGMQLVPAGRFLMGSERGMPNERPVHEVSLDHFFIDATEVTNAQYKLFCDKTGRPHPPNPRSDATYFLRKPDHPVVNVTWHDAAAFAAWAGKRLPTEAEWEKAARAGREQQEYPWGSAIDHEQANFESAHTLPVASLLANGYGIYDIVGNVWEWCADWYDDFAYRRGACVNPTGPATGTDKVLRGGSIDGTCRTLRIAYRHWMSPVRRSSDIGFRCVKDPDPASRPG